MNNNIFLFNNAGYCHSIKIIPNSIDGDNVLLRLDNMKENPEFLDFYFNKNLLTYIFGFGLLSFVTEKAESNISFDITFEQEDPNQFRKISTLILDLDKRQIKRFPNKCIFLCRYNFKIHQGLAKDEIVIEFNPQLGYIDNEDKFVNVKKFKSFILLLENTVSALSLVDFATKKV